MIHTSTPRRIRVMLTAFRDGLQSSFGGRSNVADVIGTAVAAGAFLSLLR